MEQFANPELIKTMSMGDKLIQSLMVVALGMGVVFIVLILLMFCMKLMSRIVNGAQKKKEPVASAPAQTATPLPAVSPASTSEEEEIEELMVALLAAMMFMQKDGPNLRITDVRVQGAPISSWGQAALAQNTRRL